MILSDLSIQRPTFISMITFGLAIFGLLAYKELGVDLYPKIDFPIITIISSLPGADRPSGTPAAPSQRARNRDANSLSHSHSASTCARRHQPGDLSGGGPRVRDGAIAADVSSAQRR